MKKTFISYLNVSPMTKFKAIFTIRPDTDCKIDDSFYVNLNTVDPVDFYKVIMHNKFANKMPVNNKILDRFSTHCMIAKNDFTDSFYNNYVTAIDKIEDTARSIDYIRAVKQSLENLKTLLSDIKEDLSNHVIYIDVFDSVVASSFIGISGLSDNNESSLLFTASSLGEKIEKQDYQVSFSCKKDGIISASFNTRPMCINNIYFEAIPGSFLTIDKENVKIAYVGTEFSSEKFEDMNNLRIALDLFFTPENGKIYKNEKEFNEFNDFVKYIQGSNEENKKYKINLKLREIKITCEGVNADAFGGVDGVYKTLMNYINTEVVNPIVEQSETLTSNKKDVIFKTDDSVKCQFVLSTIMD